MTASLDHGALADALMAVWVLGGVKMDTSTDAARRHVDALDGEGLIEQAGDDLYVAAGDETQARKRYAELSGVRACARCHCTEDWACEGGCWWATPDLCSTCAPESARGTA